MIERPVRLAVELGPLLAHIEIPVVLARDDVLLELNFFEEFVTEFEFLCAAELGAVAAVNEEFGRWVHGLHLLRRPGQLFDEEAV